MALRSRTETRARPGANSWTRGLTVPEYGTLRARMTPKSQRPPGQGDRRSHSAWMLEGEVGEGDKGPRGTWAGAGSRAIFGVHRLGGNMETIVGGVAGFLVWVVGNVVYSDKRRRGVGGFARLLSFWLGFPGTWLCLFLVEEGSQPALDPPPDDEEALLAEVRRARRLTIEPPDGGARSEKTEEES